jgi:beta-glucosidase
MKFKIIITSFLFPLFFPFHSANAQENKINEYQKEENKAVDTVKMNKFIDDLISQMTLEEKVGQMNQIPGFFAVTGPGKPDDKMAEEI